MIFNEKPLIQIWFITKEPLIPKANLNWKDKGYT